MTIEEVDEIIRPLCEWLIISGLVYLGSGEKWRGSPIDEAPEELAVRKARSPRSGISWIAS